MNHEAPQGARFGRRRKATRSRSISGCDLPVYGKALIDQRDLGIDRRMSQAFLKGDKLNQLVGAFDVRRAILQRARRGSWPRQALRGSGILLERNEVRGT